MAETTGGEIGRVSKPKPFTELPFMPTPSSIEIAAWIGCLFFLVAGWNQVENFLERHTRRGAPREIQPQPLAITHHDQPVTESLCQSRRKEVANEILRLDHELATLRHERRADVG